jgi:hypothetical protein
MFTFIVGCGRSGTTLLRAMLDSHGAMAIPPESYFVVPTLRVAGSRQLGSTADRARLLRMVLESPSFKEWRMEPSAVEDAVVQASPTTGAELVAAVYRTYADSQGKARYGDKTPYHVLHIPILASAYPDARFVHLIRDGRDVAASLVKSHFGPRRLEEGALYWRRYVSRGLSAGRSLPPERYQEVRYEDLVESPAETLERLTRFLDLPFDESMLSYHERADDLLGGMRRTDHLQGLHRPVKAVSDWRTTMSSEEVRMFALLAGDLAAELGYELDGKPAGPVERATAAWFRGREQVSAAITRTRARRATQRKAQVYTGSERAT